MGVEKRLERAIKMLNHILEDEELDASLKNKLLRIRHELLKAESELIGVRKACAIIAEKALYLVKYLDFRLMEREVSSEDSLIEKVLSTWRRGEVKTLSHLEKVIGEEADKVVDTLLKEGLLEVSHVEWIGGIPIVHYKRVK
ncbi:MAG: hypothetical protein DRN15_10260 [Thermoprotei archaeon]|nr:MAG: hypothetical protein DRM97_07355 [Thermoprotei archaeon]RLF21935.1 MAG: hypothetical protein DRN15_10260 [Thermoprotei archaeon]